MLTRGSVIGGIAILTILSGAGLSRPRSVNEVTVKIFFDSASPVTLFYNSGAPISLAPNDTWDQVNIWCDNNGQGTYDIGAVTLTGTSLSTPLDVVLGSGSFTGSTAGKSPACLDFGGITCQNSSIVQYIHFEGMAGDDLTGPVRVGSIYRFDVGGTVSAAVESTTSNGAAFFICEVGDVSTSGSFKAETGSILRVVTTGDCLGDIEAPNGNVALVTVGGDLAGNMTAGTHFTRIEVGGDLLGDVQAGVEIKEIEVDGNIGSAANNSAITTVKQIGSIIANRMWADISVLNSAMPTIEGWLGHIETTGGANGHFMDQSLHAGRLL